MPPQYPLLQGPSPSGDAGRSSVGDHGPAAPAGGAANLPVIGLRGRRSLVYADGPKWLLGEPVPAPLIQTRTARWKSGTISPSGTARGRPNTPWGEEDSPTLVTAVESELERDLSASVMRSGAKLERRNLDAGEALVHEGEEGRELYLLLDGMVDVEVNGDVVAEIGPGALLGERALLEGGKRTATLWASTPIRVAVIPPEAIDESVLPELAAGRKREQD